MTQKTKKKCGDFFWMSPKIYPLKCLFTLFALSVLACQNSAPKEAVLGPVATVNGEPFSAIEFSNLLTEELKVRDALSAKDPTRVRAAKERLIQDFVVSALLRQFLLKNRTGITPADIDQEINSLKKKYPDDLTFKSSLASQGLTLERWRSKLANSLAEKKAFTLLTPEGADNSAALLSEAQNYFKKTPGTFRISEAVKLKQIVVSKEDDAERVKKALKDGDAFDDLAKKYSTSPERDRGGSLGWVERGTFDVFDKAFSLPVGGTSEALKSSFGFHVLRVVEKRGGGPAHFEQIKDKLVRRLLAEKQQFAFNQWLKKSIESSEIKRDDALIEAIKVYTEGKGP